MEMSFKHNLKHFMYVPGEALPGQFKKGRSYKHNGTRVRSSYGRVKRFLELHLTRLLVKQPHIQ